MRRHTTFVTLLGATLLVALSATAGAQGFVPTGAMITPRGHHTGTALTDGTALIAGGQNAGGVVAAAEIYQRPPLNTKQEERFC